MPQIHPEGTKSPLPLNKGFTLNLIYMIRVHLAAIHEEGYLGTLVNRGDPHELRERVKAMWTTLGLVSALLCGVGLPTVISPQQSWSSDSDATTVSRVFVYSVVIAFGLSFTVVVVCTMLIFSIDSMPTDDAIRCFVIRFQYLNDISIVVFMGSIGAIVIGCIASVYENYGKGAFIVVLCFMGGLIAFLFFSFAFVSTFNSVTILEHRQLHKRKAEIGDEAAPPTGGKWAAGGAAAAKEGLMQGGGGKEKPSMEEEETMEAEPMDAAEGRARDGDDAGAAAAQGLQSAVAIRAAVRLR